MARGPRPVARGVWLVTGGLPAPAMNVYLIEDPGGGVTMFDAGASSMTKGLVEITRSMGGLNRILLGHGHPDHRGAAPGLGAPVHCHSDNVEDSTTEGRPAYMDFHRLGIHGRVIMPGLFSLWDGGPVQIAGTLSDGDDVSGFRVVLLEGHAPGQIGLFREEDGIALTSDCFYTLDPQTGIKGKPRLPHAAFNRDQHATREAVRKLAEIGPSAAWPGHADPITDDVKATLLELYNRSV